MAALNDTPAERQQALLNTIYKGRDIAGHPGYARVDDPGPWSVGRPSRWPRFLYVQTMLYRHTGLDAREVLAEATTIPLRGVGRYGWTWTPRGHNVDSINDHDEVGLTVAGMSHVPAAHDEVAVFLDVLNILVAAARNTLPEPTDTQPPVISRGELRLLLQPRWQVQQQVNPWAIEGIPPMLVREPATWLCGAPTQPEEDEDWTLILSPFLWRFEAVHSVDAYVERVEEVLGQPEPTGTPLYPSSLSLPEAIDYLNAVWKLHAHAPLFEIRRAEAAAKLALDCGTADELDARLSALYAILDHLSVPGDASNKLVDLKPYLRSKLPEDSVDQTDSAIDDLRAILRLRAYRQHPNADRWREAMNRLGVELPTSDWAGAWRQLQSRAVSALGVIREAVDQLNADQEP
jgi:hypothetical protein